WGRNSNAGRKFRTCKYEGVRAATQASGGRSASCRAGDRIRTGDVQLGKHDETATRRHGSPGPASPPLPEGGAAPTVQQRRNPAQASPFSPPLMTRPALPLATANDPTAVRLTFAAALHGLLRELGPWRADLLKDIAHARQRGMLTLAADLTRLAGRIDATWRAARVLAALKGGR